VIYVVSLVFMSVFHVLGGMTMGTGLRRLRAGFSLEAVALIVAGAFFGGGPLFKGSGLFGEINPLYFTLAQGAVFLAAISLAYFLPEGILQTFQSPAMRNLGLGGLLIFTGALGSVAVFEETPSGAIAMAVFFGISGMMLIVIGLRETFKQ